MSDNKNLIAKKWNALWADSRTYLQRMIPAGAAMLAACFTFIFFGPLEMVAFGGDSLEYRYSDVLGLLLLAAAVVFAVGTLLIPLLRGKIYNYVVSILFGITLAGYLQAAFMNGDLGLLTGDAIDWVSYRKSLVLNNLVWFAVLTAVFFVMYLHRDIWKKAVIFISLLLVVMQLAPTIGILAGTYEETDVGEEDGYTLCDQGMYEFSSEENIFVFVLDRLDYDYIEQALEEDPAFLDGLDGFTSYTNAISAYARTRPALASLLSGNTELAYQVRVEDFYQDIWTDDGKNILQTLSDQGYSIEAYTYFDYLFSDPEYAMQYVDNVTSTRGELKEGAVLKKLMQLSVYRYAPISQKPFFWADTNYYNAGIFKEAEYASYQYNDCEYAAGFADSTAERSSNCFKLYHFYGPHAPYTMNADGTLSEGTTTVEEQTIGSFTNLIRIFDQMKELGIYEDATIIITGDHGSAVDDFKPIQKETRIGLFYKPAGSAGTPLTESDAQVGNFNIAATIAKAAGADYSAYGRALDEIGENEQIERYTYKSVMGEDPLDEIGFYTYRIIGDASDLDNWEVVDYTTIESGNNFY